MTFTPQRYTIADEPHKPFIDPEEIETILDAAREPELSEVRRVIDRSLARHRLSLRETATLIHAVSPEVRELVLSAAQRLKQEIYGNRIVLFAPLYIGNRCVNNCLYCGFRTGNKQAVRRTLTDREIVAETESLEDQGHKRLILVYGEHPDYNARYIARTVGMVYGVRKGNGEIRRVNINAAPMDTDGFRAVREAGIGTYQIFQETYHPAAYRQYHKAGPKTGYDYRLTAFDRAMEAGIDDVGIGTLVGLYDWRFETLAMVRHANHLEACWNVGPHTISFPRIKQASASQAVIRYETSDDDFIRMVAILRLAVPYTGLILTARETPALRDELIRYGISQIDGGTRLEIGGYSEPLDKKQELDKEQFMLNDDRSLAEIVSGLSAKGYIPSFCTACYRKGRTGEHFMEFSVNGFIKRFCTPNAILTYAEYLEDYTSGKEKEEGWQRIEAELARVENAPEMISGAEERSSSRLREKLDRIRAGERDILY